MDPDSPEAEDWEEQHRLFHDALISACPSPWTLQFCRVLFTQFRRYRRIILAKYWSSKQVRHTIDDEHERLLAAVLDRRADMAVSMLMAHYENSARRVIDEYIRREASGVAIRGRVRSTGRQPAPSRS